jgi:putative ABC transport system permease protein
LRANLVRFALTGLAVIIGVAFMTGTLVLTATIQAVFDDLFTNIFRGTDVVVRAPERLKSDFGAGERPNVPADLLDTVRQAPGVADAQGSVIVSYAQIIGPDGEPVGDPGAGPPVLGFGWVDSEDLNQWNLLQGGRAPTTDSEVVIDKRSADKGDIKVGDEVTILTTERPRNTRSSALRGSGAPTVLRVRARRCSSSPRRSA